MSRLSVSLAPHIASPKTTATIMRDVLIALTPATVAGIVIFGLRALLVVCVTVAAAVLSEYLFCLVTKREQTVTDLSAAVTGLLLALNLPASVPIWQAVIGAAFAIIAVKCLFGGIGQNFANPAITARIFMLVAFTSLASSANPIIVDGVSGPTPLALIAKDKPVELLDLLLGLRGGAIGETCVIALVLGGVYLLVRRVIKPHAPLAMIITVFLLSLALEGGDAYQALAWTMSGGLFIGAIFMATDYSTTPTNALGKLIFGVGAGVITVLIRFFGSYPEGVSFGILLMNIVTPYIDKLSLKKPFGGDVE